MPSCCATRRFRTRSSGTTAAGWCGSAEVRWAAASPARWPAAAQAAEPYYRVTVALARQAVTAFGREEPLKPGMVLDADILGERRRLIEWVFEPLYSLKGRIGND